MRPWPAAGRVAAVAALLALGAWLWSAETGRLAPEPDVAPGGPAAVASRPQPGAAPTVDRLPPEAAPSGALALATSLPAANQAQAEAPSRAKAGAPVWDLCGVGRMPVPSGAVAQPGPEQALAALPPHLGRDAWVQAYAALATALDAGPPRWRAAALMLRGSDATGWPQALALPELARASDDPVVAMWALQRCDLGASCLEMAERWTQVEPQNLAPWVDLLARQPQRRGELITRMAAATRFDRHEHALSQAVLEAMPAGVASYLQPALWIDVIGVEAAMAMPAFNAVFDHCREPLAPGSERMQACAAVARTLVERSDGFVGVRLGLRLAERSYLGKAEAATRRKALDTLLAPPDELFDREQPLSCAGVARTRAWVEQRARLGELGALRAQAAQRTASAASGSR
ncbi:MAG: hypothetical protein IPF94_10155 [Betaproteobacteria bacterium]|nr:hypothetical protein [Betaproteobacteria bacterium]